MKINFNLDKPSEENSIILFRASYNGKRVRFSIGQTIPTKYWNTTKQRIKESRNYPQYREFNTWLDYLQAEMQKYYNDCMVKKEIPTKQDIKEEFHHLIHKTKRSRRIPAEFMPFFAWYTKKQEKILTKNTIKIYNQVQTHLKAFCKNRRVSLDFNDITVDRFHSDYIEYLSEEPRSFSSNTIGKHIKTVKAVMKEAQGRGFHNNESYKSSKFNSPKQEIDNVYLRIEQLHLLYKQDLKKEKRLENIRDAFLVASFTGLRYSDFSRLSKKNIQFIKNSKGEKIKIINIRTQKTGAGVMIPLNPIVNTILKKYKGSAPKTYSNQEMNRGIKKIALMAGLDEELKLTRSKGNKPITEMSPLYENVTTHTARRSFATNAFKMGVPSISIMKITGHKTETSFLKYIKISQEENAALIADNVFFKIAPLRAVK